MKFFITETVMPDEEKSRFHGAHRWVAFGVISTVYFFVYFHRVSTSVIAPDLLATFQTNATILGIMSSMYFYLYAVEQPLVGYLSDRLGSRWVVSLWSLVAALGCLVFGLAPTIMWAAVGRALIGFGVGGVFVPGMKAFSQWFKERDFGTLTGMLLASGNLGAIAATTPLAWVVDLWGWRSSFVVIGGITFGLAVTAFLLIRDPKTAIVDSDGPPGSIFQIVTSFRFWILAAIFFGVFGVYLTFQGLWATTYLMSLLRLDLLHASGLTMLVPIGFVLGAPFSGWLSSRFSLDKVHMVISLLAIETGVWMVLVFGGHGLGTAGIIPFLVFLGGAAGGLGAVLWALVRETTPASILGLTTGLLNPFPFAGVAVLQVWTGTVLDRAGRVGDIYPPEAYKAAFFDCLLIFAACLFLSICFKKHLSGGR